jgi:hypothetical protein
VRAPRHRCLKLHRAGGLHIGIIGHMESKQNENGLLAHTG